MNTDHPTTKIFFTFAYTYCGMQIYERDKNDFLALLTKLESVEVIDREPQAYEKVDTRILTHLFLELLRSHGSKIKSL